MRGRPLTSRYGLNVASDEPSTDLENMGRFTPPVDCSLIRLVDYRRGCPVDSIKVSTEVTSAFPCSIWRRNAFNCRTRQEVSVATEEWEPLTGYDSLREFVAYQILTEGRLWGHEYKRAPWSRANLIWLSVPCIFGLLIGSVLLAVELSREGFTGLTPAVIDILAPSVVGSVALLLSHNTGTSTEGEVGISGRIRIPLRVVQQLPVLLSQAVFFSGMGLVLFQTLVDYSTRIALVTIAVSANSAIYCGLRYSQRSRFLSRSMLLAALANSSVALRAAKSRDLAELEHANLSILVDMLRDRRDALLLSGDTALADRLSEASNNIDTADIRLRSFTDRRA